jgi:hypothetical protein
VPSAPPDRLPPDDLAELTSQLEGGALPLVEDGAAGERLHELREGYERYAVAIAERLALPLPGWLPGEDAVEYWRVASGHRQRRKPLP